MTRPALWETVLAAALVASLLCALAWLRSRPIVGEERFPAAPVRSAAGTSGPLVPVGGAIPKRPE